VAVEDRYRRMPFPEAIDYLRQKIAIPTERWDDIRESEHDAAFIVAGAKGSLLTDLQRAVNRAIADGQGVEQFTETFKQISQNWVHRGDKDWRARIIYQTNMRMAYAAGRYQYQLDPDVLRLQPYLQYLHGGSQDPRPAHIALHERVFPARELPFYPPNGFGCSCRTVSLSERDLERLGLEVSRFRRGDLVPYELPNGQKGEALVQPDRGFDYVPGQTRAEERQRMIEAVIARLEPEQAQWVRQEVAQINQRIRERRQQEGMRVQSDQDWTELVAQLGGNPGEVVAWGRDSQGRLVWLERGNRVAGLQHIIRNHEAEFVSVGIPVEELPVFLMQMLREGEQIGRQGRDRPVYRIRYRGQDLYVAITVGDNGFVVGANPVSQSKLRKLLRRQNAPTRPPTS